MKILVTGGTGYIGSHTCVDLLQHGFDVVVVDDLRNSKEEVIDRIRTITKRELVLYRDNLQEEESLFNIFRDHKIDAVIHFAGSKIVGESIQQPLLYYENNIASTLTLCNMMKYAGVKQLVFSSSAAVYGNPYRVPITEITPLDPISPYGRSKIMIETMLRDLFISDPSWKISILRYFNPVGAHESGLIGEDPITPSKTLFSQVIQAVLGNLEYLPVYGMFYPTEDGTGVRDYIHVVDLARAHRYALNHLCKQTNVTTYNLGTGIGYSVLDVLNMFEHVSGKKIRYNSLVNRPGDIAISYADPSLANKELGWRTEKVLHHMCEDALKYVKGV